MEEEVLNRTSSWIQKSVIGLNCCPFASKVVEEKSLRLIYSQAMLEEELWKDMIGAFQLLLTHTKEEINTLILIHPSALTSFSAYLDFVEILRAMMEEEGLSDHFQLATFHPSYQFAGTEEEDKQNYTNRSPFPMIQILREDEVEAALQHYPSPDQIPLRNIDTFQALSWDEIAQLYES